MIEFEPQTHTYRVAGVVVPSVTQILDAAGDVSSFCRDELAAERGSRVHEACALLATGKLDWSTVDSRIMGYVLSYQSFLGMVSKWELQGVERRVYSPYGYAGTYDVDFDAALIDIKTGAPVKWHELQTAAYAKAVGKTKRAALFLDKSGKSPRYVEHKSRTDWPEFLERVNKYHDNHG